MPSLQLAKKQARRPKIQTVPSSECVRVGIIGCGYWGPNLIRNFHEISASRVAAIADLNGGRLKAFEKKIPGALLTRDYRDILRDPSIDAVAIATPVSTHAVIAAAALKAGKHVLIEKPLTATIREGELLIQLASRHKKILMAGHTFEYHPAVRKIQQLLESGELGNIHYLDSVRGNLGLYQSDGLNVVWDLAPHDISIVLLWLKKMPVKVSAWGRSFLKKGIEDVAFIRMEFPGDVVAHLHVSWLAPAKKRSITVVGDKKMVLYDDLENVEKVKVVDQGVHLDPSDPDLRVGYRFGDILSPRLPVTEPLSIECSHFIQCILRGEKPQTDGLAGLQVVRVLEAAGRSLKKGGEPVCL